MAQWSERPALVTLPGAEERWGIGVGRFRLWPRLAVEGGYDSNLFRQDVSESPEGAPMLRIRPSLTLVNPKPGKVRFYLDVSGDVRLYFSDQDYVNEQRNGGVTSTIEVDLFPNGPLTLRLFDRFRRALSPRNFATAGNYNRNFNLGGAQLVWKPGGGALELGIEYAFAFDLYDELPDANTYYHDLGLQLSWRFLPLTTAFVDVDFKILQYTTEFLNESVGMRNVDSMPLRAVLGVRGHITRRLSVLLQAGWAYGFYASGSSFNGPIGLARFSLRVTPTTLLQLGYARDYEDSTYANYYGEHRVFFSAEQRLWSRLGLKADVGYHIIDYARFVPTDPDYTVTQRNRNEHVLRLGAEISVDATRWLGFKVSYAYEAMFSDFAIRHEGKVADVPTYYRHQVFAAVVGRY